MKVDVFRGESKHKVEIEIRLAVNRYFCKSLLEKDLYWKFERLSPRQPVCRSENISLICDKRLDSRGFSY
jgi:hypothetical protein